MFWMPSPLHCGIRSSSFQLVRAEPRTLKLCTGIAAFTSSQNRTRNLYSSSYDDIRSVSISFNWMMFWERCRFDLELDVFFFFVIMCTWIQYFACISYVALWTAGLLTRIRARLAVVAQRQWHPPCNRKWNRNTLLQINVCFQLCGWLNWQTDSFVLMAYFLFISNVFKWKPLFCSLFFFFLLKCVSGQLQYMQVVACVVN